MPKKSLRPDYRKYALKYALEIAPEAIPKTVTRRLGWKTLKPGTLIHAFAKA